LVTLFKQKTAGMSSNVLDRVRFLIDIEG
jgi:hypothetical protein